MKLIGTPFLASYIGTNSQTLIQGVSDIMQNKSKELGIQLTLKNPPNFQPLKVFKSMSVTDWLSYFNKNYDIIVNTKEQ